jgi:hypothetical protein
VHHVFGQPAGGDAQAPAPSFRIADLLDKDGFLRCALTQKTESVWGGLCGWIDGDYRRAAEKRRREGAARAVVFLLRRRRREDAVEVERILVLAICRW